MLPNRSGLGVSALITTYNGLPEAPSPSLVTLWNPACDEGVVMMTSGGSGANVFVEISPCRYV